MTEEKLFEFILNESFNSAEKQDLNEVYVPEEMRPVSVPAEEYVNNFFNKFCDENGFVIHDKIKKYIGDAHRNVFAWYRTWRVLEKYPLDKAEVLEYVERSHKPHRDALFDYVKEFCNKHTDEENIQ